MAQYEQAQDYSSYKCKDNEKGLSKLCNGAANFELFYISFLSFLYNSFYLFFKLVSLVPLSYAAIRCKALKNQRASYQVKMC
jgi:hypothetical protein